MTTKSIRNGLMALLLCAFAFAGAEEPKTSRVTVTWAPADSLSEVKQNQMQRGWMHTEDWEKKLGDHLRDRADGLLPPGQKLDVSIDDIKLAGDFEPWHSPQAQDIRFMKDIYPPRIDLHYRLTAADGHVLRENSAKLRDPAYLENGAVLPNDTDPLRFDKYLIDHWLRTEFRGDKS